MVIKQQLQKKLKKCCKKLLKLCKMFILIMAFRCIVNKYILGKGMGYKYIHYKNQYGGIKWIQPYQTAYTALSTDKLLVMRWGLGLKLCLKRTSPNSIDGLSHYSQIVQDF